MADDSEQLSVYLVQPDVVWHDAPANRMRVRRMLDEHPPRPGSLIALPETFASGFTSDVSAGTDTPAGETAQWLAELADELQCHVIGGIITTDPLTGLGLNQAVCCSPEAGEVARYTKCHRFPLSREADCFAAGEEVTTFEVGSGEICPLICYDLRFPETWRRGVGSEVFVLIANWPASRMNHWHALLRARAIENQAFVVGVNRTGTDPYIQYTGGSVVYDYDGHCLTEMDERPGVVATALDLTALRQFRRKLPFLPEVVRERQLTQLQA